MRYFKDFHHNLLWRMYPDGRLELNVFEDEWYDSVFENLDELNYGYEDSRAEAVEVNREGERL